LFLTTVPQGILLRARAEAAPDWHKT